MAWTLKKTSRTLKTALEALKYENYEKSKENEGL